MSDICKCYVQTNESGMFGIVYGRCNGTKEIDLCTCCGDRSRCDFYLERRDKTKKVNLEEIVDIWLNWLVKSNDKNKSDELTMEEIQEEIRSVEASVKKEKQIEDTYRKNITNLEAYLKTLYKLKKKKEGIE